jgi:GH18 family chitinase
MLVSSSKRTAFVTKAVAFLKLWGFEGLDLAYLYPGSVDRAGFTALIKELRAAFSSNWELTATVAASATTVDAGYDVREISNLLDAVHLMAFDLHGGLEPTVNHHAALYGTATDSVSVDQA